MIYTREERSNAFSLILLVKARTIFSQHVSKSFIIPILEQSKRQLYIVEINKKKQ